MNSSVLPTHPGRPKGHKGTRTHDEDVPEPLSALIRTDSQGADGAEKRAM